MTVVWEDPPNEEVEREKTTDVVGDDRVLAALGLVVDHLVKTERAVWAVHKRLERVERRLY